MSSRWVKEKIRESFETRAVNATCTEVRNGVALYSCLVMLQLGATVGYSSANVRGQLVKHKSPSLPC